MRRREFFPLIGGVAAWPLTARAQQSETLRRVGVLMGFAENDPEGTLWFSSFVQAFREGGWIDGRNVRIDVRWDASNSDPKQRFAKELISLRPGCNSGARDTADRFAPPRNANDPNRI